MKVGYERHFNQVFTQLQERGGRYSHLDTDTWEIVVDTSIPAQALDGRRPTSVRLIEYRQKVSGGKSRRVTLSARGARIEGKKGQQYDKKLGDATLCAIEQKLRRQQ